MKCNLYDDVHAFYRDTYDVLMRSEAQNMIPLGNIIIGHEGKDKTDWRDPCATSRTPEGGKERRCSVCCPLHYPEIFFKFPQSVPLADQ